RGCSLGTLGGIERDSHGRQQGGAPRLDRIERTGANQRLDRAAIDHALVDSPAEIEEVLIRPAAFARGNDGFDRGGAGALDRAQAVTDSLVVDRLEAIEAVVAARESGG